MRFLILGLFYWTTMAVSAQNSTVPFTVFSTHEGLSNNQINCMEKDARGYLWVGTAEGLDRFDGRHFRQFFAERTDTNSLNGNYIFDILENRPGELLIATNNGLSVLNTFTNTFQNNLVSEPLLKKGHGMVVSNLYKDRQQRLWVNYNGTIDILNDRLEFLYRLTDQPWAAGLKGINMYYEKSFTDNKGLVWLASDNQGICVVDEKNQQLFNWQNNPFNYPFFKKNAVRSFYMDTISNRLYYGLWSAGLQYYDFSTGKTQEQNFGINYYTEQRCINSITLLKDGNLLCTGGKALYIVNPLSLDYHVQNKANSKGDLPGSFTNVCSTTDNEGNSWVGTYSFGLLEIPVSSVSYTQLDLPMKKLLPEYFPNCTAGVEVDENFYLAYNLDGLIELNRGTSKINNYKIISPEGKTMEVFRLSRAGSHTLWIGTGLGIYSFDTRSKKTGIPKELPSFTRTLHVSFMSDDMDGNTWISFTQPNAVGMYNKKEKKFYYYKDYLFNGQSFYNKEYKITCIKPGEDGDVWMTSGIKGGIACYHAGTKEWENYPRKGSRNYLLFSDNGIADLSPGTDHTLWLAFDPGTGLVRYDYKNDSLIFYEHKNGLLSDNINSIDKDNQGNLLLLSNGGVDYFDVKTTQIRSQPFSNAEKNWSRLYNQFYDPQNNQLLYSVNDKILLIPNSFQKNDSGKLQVYIEDVKPLDDPGFSYTPGNRLQLNHSHSSISISLSAPDFTENNLVSFAYMLQGYDKEWSTTDSAQTLIYKNLPPGQYTFLAKAKKHNGDWGPVNESLLIRVNPSWWETWWFMLLSLLFFIGLGWWMIRARIRSIKYKAGLKHKIAETEMAALQAQMNPHFIFNCLSAIDNLIQTDQSEKATTYLSKFARLIRSVLDGAKNNVVSFQADFESIKLYLQMEQFRCSNKFSFEMIADDELMHSDIRVPAMVIQPFVENAIFHGLLNKQEGERNLRITAELKNEWILYTITDNGVGRARAKEIRELNRPQHQSEGIRISKERMQLFNEDEKMEAIHMTDLFREGKSVGTKVLARVKIKENG